MLMSPTMMAPPQEKTNWLSMLLMLAVLGLAIWLVYDLTLPCEKAKALGKLKCGNASPSPSASGTPNPGTSSPAPNTGLPEGAIAGIVIGVVVLLGGVAVLAWFQGRNVRDRLRTRFGRGGTATVGVDKIPTWERLLDNIRGLKDEERKEAIEGLYDTIEADYADFKKWLNDKEKDEEEMKNLKDEISNSFVELEKTRPPAGSFDKAPSGE
jgi:hypothetical protein